MAKGRIDTLFPQPVSFIFRCRSWCFCPLVIYLWTHSLEDKYVLFIIYRIPGYLETRYFCSFIFFKKLPPTILAELFSVRTSSQMLPNMFCEVDRYGSIKLRRLGDKISPVNTYLMYTVWPAWTNVLSGHLSVLLTHSRAFSLWYMYQRFIFNPLQLKTSLYYQPRCWDSQNNFILCESLKDIILLVHIFCSW